MIAMTTLVDRWLYSHECCSYFTFLPSLFRTTTLHTQGTYPAFHKFAIQINIQFCYLHLRIIYISLVMFVSSPSLFAPHLVADIIRRPNCCNMPAQAALLIGKIDHARKAWEDLSSILTLKVRLTVIANCGAVSG